MSDTSTDTISNVGGVGSAGSFNVAATSTPTGNGAGGSDPNTSALQATNNSLSRTLGGATGSNGTNGSPSNMGGHTLASLGNPTQDPMHTPGPHDAERIRNMNRPAVPPPNPNVPPDFQDPSPIFNWPQDFRIN